jgi:hypothetical protein
MAISEKQREMILQCLEDGLSLRKACVKAEVARPAAVLDIARTDIQFGEQYARAREAGYLARADRLRDDAWDMSIPADHKRIICDVQRWELSKMLPKLFGERLDLVHSGSVARTDQLTEDELRAVLDAKTPPTSK